MKSSYLATFKFAGTSCSSGGGNGGSGGRVGGVGGGCVSICQLFS
jgi:hypothetical protein